MLTSANGLSNWQLSPAQLRRNSILLLTVAILSAGLVGTRLAWQVAENKSNLPLLPGLGPHTRRFTTSSGRAQKYCDQGLNLLFGFNHQGAVRSFEAAVAFDPDCAMAYWGIAMANGPHVNNMTVPFSQAKAAWRAICKAKELSRKASRIEQALINALDRRWSNPPAADRHSLDVAYAAAMRAVFHEFPRDADVGALTAEAIMDADPEPPWSVDGQTRASGKEVREILDKVLAIEPDHVFGLHLFIHEIEGSRHPEVADRACDRLRGLAPGLGHLLHMSSHIDVLRGRWNDAVIANERAIAADNEYREQIPEIGSYRMYVRHNHHMLAFAAMMQGQRSKAANEMLAEISEDDDPASVDPFFAIPFEVKLRFGLWQEVATTPPPPAEYPFATAMWRYARGIAYTALKDIEQAKTEERAFAQAVGIIPQTANFRKTPSSQLLSIAAKMLAGEILYREGKHEEAFGSLREAVHLEDSLDYREPPNWVLPVRHALGAALLDAHRCVEAEVVYREDLARHPENGWALHGLARSLQMQGRYAESLVAASRFKGAWQYADTAITSSCCCLPGKQESGPE